MKSSIQEYLWLNPIVEGMIEKERDIVLRILNNNGYSVVSCTAGAAVTYEAYRKLINTASRKPVIDARCPQVTALISRKYPDLSEHIAPIAPILSACAEILYREYVESSLEQSRLTVVAPCIALANDGRARFGNRIRFITWKQLIKEIVGLKVYARLNSSPVPPGFFRNLGNYVVEANGKIGVEAILHAVDAGEIPESIRLVELLYCKDGCHNGDGVVG